MVKYNTIQYNTLQYIGLHITRRSPCVVVIVAAAVFVVVIVAAVAVVVVVVVIVVVVVVVGAVENHGLLRKFPLSLVASLCSEQFEWSRLAAFTVADFDSANHHQRQWHAGALAAFCPPPSSRSAAYWLTVALCNIGDPFGSSYDEYGLYFLLEMRNIFLIGNSLKCSRCCKYQ